MHFDAVIRMLPCQYVVAHRRILQKNVRNSYDDEERNKKHNGTHRTMIDSFFCEWMWRKRNAGNDIFEVMLVDIAAFWPPG